MPDLKPEDLMPAEVEAIMRGEVVAVARKRVMVWKTPNGDVIYYTFADMKRMHITMLNAELEAEGEAKGAVAHQPQIEKATAAQVVALAPKIKS